MTPILCAPKGKVKSQLKGMLGQLERSADLSRIMSINASCICAKLQGQSLEVAGLGVLVSQFQEISANLKAHVRTIQESLHQVNELMELVNLAGRQRMLVQKTLKLALLQRIPRADLDALASEIAEVSTLFQESQELLGQETAENPEAQALLADVSTLWKNFQAHIQSQEYMAAEEISRILVGKINLLISTLENS